MNYIDAIGVGLLGAFIILATGIYYILIHKRSEKYWQKQRRRMEFNTRFNKIKVWIKKQEQLGKLRSDIESQLKDLGWEQKQIKNAFKENIKESVLNERNKGKIKKEDLPEVPEVKEGTKESRGTTGTKSTKATRHNKYATQQRGLQKGKVSNTKQRSNRTNKGKGSVGKFIRNLRKTNRRTRS